MQLTKFKHQYNINTSQISNSFLIPSKGLINFFLSLMNLINSVIFYLFYFQRQQPAFLFTFTEWVYAGKVYQKRRLADFIFIQKHVGNAIVDGELATSLWTHQLPFNDLHLQQSFVQGLLQSFIQLSRIRQTLR